MIECIGRFGVQRERAVEIGDGLFVVAEHQPTSPAQRIGLCTGYRCLDQTVIDGDGLIEIQIVLQRMKRG